MKFSTVEQRDTLESEAGYYDLCIVASGFEARSTHVASVIKRDISRKLVVLGFDDQPSKLDRRQNDLYFASWSDSPILIVDEVADEFIFRLLRSEWESRIGREFRILVDYSVMSRSWYAAIITWVRHLSSDAPVILDFVYSCGQYADNYPALSISEIESVPGFEGISGGFRRTSAVFGLGYDKYATLAVYDRIEPDNVYCCVAKQSPVDSGAERALRENSVIVETAKKIIELPLVDVSETVRQLCDHVLGIERDTHIVIVPMGPKTHVLATLLMAIRLPWVTCLHAKGTRIEPVQVRASGVLSITRVSFLPEVGSA